MSLNSALQLAAKELAGNLPDYRNIDGLSTIDCAHVLQWVEQFEETTDTKIAFLKELATIYGKTYFSKERVESSLASLVAYDKLVGSDANAFWATVDVLDIQTSGTSQSDLRSILAREVKRSLGVRITSNDRSDRHSIYIDDALFSGNRVFNDIKAWCDRVGKPRKLTVIVLDLATGGEFSVGQRLKSLEVNPVMWRFALSENKSNAGARADVFRLREYPSDARSRKFAETRLRGELPKLLRGLQANESKRFSSEPNRALVEEVLWRAGLKCLEMCTQMSANARPLGYCSANGSNRLGFGSLFASYRNCPNNAPVALWAGSPWIPLLRRRTNA